MQSSIILGLNSWMASHNILIVLMPILGDVFVFSYPFYLIYLYFSPYIKIKISRWRKIIGINKNNTIDKNINKYSALNIFLAAGISIVVNYIIKFFISVPRPFHVLDLAVDPKKALILDGLPTDTFPSDHASLGMAVAASTLIFGYQSENKSMIIVGWVFLAFTLIMNFARITIGVHRPADILGGMGVGILVAILMSLPSIQKLLQKNIYDYIIKFQEYIFMIFKK